MNGRFLYNNKYFFVCNIFEKISFLVCPNTVLGNSLRRIPVRLRSGLRLKININSIDIKVYIKYILLLSNDQYTYYPGLDVMLHSR